MEEQNYIEPREQMIENQLIARGIKDQRVLDAMRSVPRHLFVDCSYRHEAYKDYPLPIGCEQTISQPYIVALMTESLQLKAPKRCWKSEQAPVIKQPFSPNWQDMSAPWKARVILKCRENTAADGL